MTTQESELSDWQHDNLPELQCVEKEATDTNVAQPKCEAPSILANSLLASKINYTYSYAARIVLEDRTTWDPR